MKVHLHAEPFSCPSDRILRLPGVGFIALGVTVLSVWNPLAQPGPTICLLRHTVGLPCPLCGMTRGVALCLRGRFREASLFNPLTVPVLLVAGALALKWSVEFATGRRLDLILPRWLSRSLYYSVILVALLNWIYLLIYRREDPFAGSWLGQLWDLVTNEVFLSILA